MKMTFQPKKRQRSKVHGFRARMSTRGGQKEEKGYQHRPRKWPFFLPEKFKRI